MTIDEVHLAQDVAETIQDVKIKMEQQIQLAILEELILLNQKLDKFKFNDYGDLMSHNS